MPLLDLSKLTTGLSRTWVGYLRDWDRSLRAGNHPTTTRYNYLLAAAQLGRYLAEYSPDPDADAAANDMTGVTRAHVELFQAWMIDTRSAATAVNKHKCLQQFFRFLVEEQEIDHSPMDRVRQPKTPQKLVPVMRAEDTGKLLEACRGGGFVNLRDEALIRLYCNTGARLAEIGNLHVDDVDLNTDSVYLHGKGAKDRRVRFGPKTGRGSSAAAVPRQPSVSATMICARDEQVEIVEPVGLPLTGPPREVWVAPGYTYTCTYPSKVGKLVLSVRELTGPVDTTAYFNSALAASPGSTDIPDLGDGAFAATDGSVYVRICYPGERA